MYQQRTPSWDVNGEVVLWPDAAAVVADWWSRYEANGGFEKGRAIREETAREEAADELVDSLCESGGPGALPLLLALAEAAPNRESLFFLGAGPVEDFVIEHGDQQARALVEAALGSDRFRIALSGVWLDSWKPLSEEAMSYLGPFLGDDTTTRFG